MNIKKNKIIIIGIISFMVLVSCGLLGYNYYNKNVKSDNVTTLKSNSTSDIDTDDGDEDINWDSYESSEISNTDDVTITKGGVYTLTGTINGTVRINTEEDVKLILNNVTIKATSGPAIYVESANNVVIYLNDGTTNTVEDSSSYSGFEEDIDACIYSKDDLVFEGGGSLVVKANYQDGIVSKDDLKFVNGTYTITASDDGIRGKDSVYILDGNFTIKAGGDGIKSSNDTDTTKGFVLIENGKISINAGSDGIQAITKLVINNGDINITASEGLEATYVIINDGAIKINATDDGINASNKSTISTPTIEINGGNLTVDMGQGDTDALDANGNIYINGGKITITAQSAFDYDNEGKLNGGEVIVNGSKVDELTNQMMGGGMAPGNMQKGQAPTQGQRRVR